MITRINVRCPYCQTLCRVPVRFEEDTDHPIKEVYCDLEGDVLKVLNEHGIYVYPDGCGETFIVRASLEAKAVAVFMEHKN